MTDNPAMTAHSSPHMEEHVTLAPHDLADFPGFTFTGVRGQGRGPGHDDAYVSTDSDLIYHRFLELRRLCRSELEEEICDRMASAAWTGRKDDGVVFTTTVNHFARIVGKAPGATL